MHNTLKYAHYDLKPSNIGQTGKIFDFGECAPASRCGHTHITEDYTPYNYSTHRVTERTKTADLFAMGVTLLEMICGKITVPHKINGNANNKQAYGWKLVESNDTKSWKAQWAVGL